MKHMKRANIYQCSNYNCTFDPNNIVARSYRWWVFVAKIEGKVVFNNYRYSNSTSKHQSKVRFLLNQLGIKIDLELPLPNGLPGSYRRGLGMDSSQVPDSDTSLASLIQTAEEYLCDRISIDEIKRQERNEKATLKRRMKKLENYLENSVAFRDYDIVEAKHFGNPSSPIASKIAVHQVVDMNSMERDVENAIYNFQRDGFGSIVFYVGGA